MKREIVGRCVYDPESEEEAPDGRGKGDPSLGLAPMAGGRRFVFTRTFSP